MYKIEYKVERNAKFGDFKQHVITATSQFSLYWPTVQKMVDPFKIETEDGGADSPTTGPPAEHEEQPS